MEILFGSTQHAKPHVSGKSSSSGAPSNEEQEWKMRH